MRSRGQTVPQREARAIPVSVEQLIFALAASLTVLAVFRFNRSFLMAIPLFIAFALYLRKPCTIVYILVAVGFLRLDAWLSGWLSLPFGKVFLIFTALSVSAVLLLTESRLNRPGRPALLFGCYLLSALVFGSIASSGDGILPWLSESVYAASYFAVVFLLVNRFKRLERIMILIVLIGVLTSFINILEFLDPTGIGLSHSEGRAAGLLKNANTSAFIVNVSMIASLYLLKISESRRLVLCMTLLQGLFFFGVFLTFSREGIILFALIFLAQFFYIKRRSRMALVLVLSVTVLWFGAYRAVRYIDTAAEGDVRLSFKRISALAGGRIDDNDRLDLLDLHMGRFLESPITGKGIYSATDRTIRTFGYSGECMPQGPHNTFVLILSETGIFPLAAYLIFLASVFAGLLYRRKNAGGREMAMRGCLLLMFSAYLIHHLFSHTLLLSRYSMVMMAIFSLPAGVRGAMDCRSGTCG